MKIREILPHRYPFLLVDKITELKAGEVIQGYKDINISSHVFMGHFLGHPICPGVLILEGMAQTGGVLAFESVGAKVDPRSKAVYFTDINGAKFRNPVRPGDRPDYEMQVVKNRGSIWIFKGQVFMNGNLVAGVELKATTVDR